MMDNKGNDSMNTKINSYIIEKITNDNRRPNMSGNEYLVRYNPSKIYGWLSCRPCKDMKEVEEFVRTLNK